MGSKKFKVSLIAKEIARISASSVSFAAVVEMEDCMVPSALYILLPAFFGNID